MAIGEGFDSLLGAAQAGGEWAFATLYNEYNPRIQRYFAARAPAAAEDLAADVWLAAARGLRRFSGTEDGWRSWLFTIAHRRLADFWEQGKREQGKRRSPQRLEPYLDHEEPVAPDDPERSALESTSAQAAVRRIAEVLTPDQAEVILLRLLGDLDVDQVAAVLGKRPGAVRVLQHRALRKLSKEISLEIITDGVTD